ncbi:MAG: hypothetical protein KBS91_03710, partial [Firmicutes bacterium]|nr:hypothetical protein [Candidatus Caballimonas caccae]
IMQDYNDKNNKSNIFELVKKIASSYDGKSNKDILSAIYTEAKKGKQNGTLTNEEIDKFAIILSPFLDDKQAKLLSKIVVELKKI